MAKLRKILIALLLLCSSIFSARVAFADTVDITVSNTSLSTNAINGETSTEFSFDFAVPNSAKSGDTTVEVTGTIVWADNNDQDGLRPDSVIVNLLANGEVVASQTVTADNDWNYAFIDLPKYDNGNEIVYRVTEAITPDGYTLSVGISGRTITNTHTPETTEVSGTKTWADNNDQDGKRPDSITVNLLANGTVVDTKTVTADDNWSYSFTDLPKYDNGKKIITYAVTEDTVADYTTAYDGYNITNSYTPGETSITVTKVWADNNDQDGIRPDAIQVQLYANGEKSGDIITLTATDNWTYTWTGLAEKANQRTITYTVEEVSAVDGYTSETTQTSANNFTITNTHTPETTEVSGTKTWADNNDQDGIRPESIVVHLLANGVDTGQTKEVSQTDNWTYQFENLPKYQNGQEIVYTVSEDSVGGYETIISGFNITNSHTPETTEVSGTKTWNDNDDQDGKRPDSITVNLLANGTKVASQEVTADTNWTYTFSNLAKYANGSAITYTVTEDSVDNYTTTINGYDITNSYTPGKTSLTVTKVWDDSDDQDGLRPNSIDVQLYANGKKSGDVVTLTAADNWTYTWTNLAEKANKKDIVYSVKEVTEVDGYTTTEGKVENGNVTITNTLVPVIPEEPKTTDVTFSKVEVNGSAELVGASLKVVSGETADGQIATDVKTGENLAWTSGDTAKVFSLSEGTYTMVESQAPAGYELAESITFRVTADGQVEVKGTDGSWTVQAGAIIKMEDAKTPVIPEKPQSNTPTVDDPTTPSSNSDKQSEKKQEKKSLLPSTGNSSGLGLMMLGLALVLSVIFGFVYKAKRAKA